MPQARSVTLRKAVDTDLDRLYHLTYSETEWQKFDAPYWPMKHGTKSEYEQGPFQRFKDGKTALLIEWEGEIVGTVTAYWEDESTRWLEVGITIFEVKNWSKGIGRAALTEWITRLFAAHEVQRIGLTTWSGNPHDCVRQVDRDAGRGQLRKVRYFEGVYYDSVKMGVLREEWNER